MKFPTKQDFLNNRRAAADSGLAIAEDGLILCIGCPDVWVDISVPEDFFELPEKEQWEDYIKPILWQLKYATSEEGDHE